MKISKLSDEALELKSQTHFLEVAGFVIKIIFEPTEGVIYKRLLLRNIENILDESGFLVSQRKRKFDFSLVVEPTPKGVKIIEKKEGKEHYDLSLKRKIGKRKVSTSYSAGLPAFFRGLQEGLIYLVKDDGFIMHASGVGKKGKLYIFSASSGGGKSAVSDLLSKNGFQKFSDDKIIIRKIENSWCVFSIPIPEKKGKPTRIESSDFAMFILRKSKRTEKQELVSPVKKLRFLISQLWLSEKGLSKQILKTAVSFAKENRFYILKTNLDKKALIKTINEV